MTPLVFLASLGAIVVLVLAMEADGARVFKADRQGGLATWLTRGNWPAKVGSLLIIVGVGALLRYAVLTIDVPAQVKLAGGIVIALALGLGSMLVPAGAARRPVSLALGGAGFGVAYLTAYSAFGLFGYLSNPLGLALLCLTSAAAAMYAVTRSALSLALLAMTGAYLAPAFATTDPGPAIVYGYYAAGSLMTMVMVAARGWRALIHLSFAFTLIGGAFFAWTSLYYTAAHADVMLPMLLLLSATHVAMPILERKPSGMRIMERLDFAYTLALPTVAALLAVLLAASRSDLSIEFMGLGVIWALAAAALMMMSRPGGATHLVTAVALFVLGGVVRFRDLQWELLLLGLSVGALAAAAWRSPAPGRLHNTLAGFVVMFGALHVLDSMGDSIAALAFVNGAFIERILAALLLIVAGAVCRRIRQPLDTLLLAVGILWMFISIGIEMVRWELATLALISHWFTILVVASLWVPGRRVRIADDHTGALLVLMLVTAWWASSSASSIAAWLSLTAGASALIGATIRPEYEEDFYSERLGAALLAPAIAFVWALGIGARATPDHLYRALSIAVLVALASLLAGRLAHRERTSWLANGSDILGTGFAAALLASTTLHIARGPWAAVFELACLVGLVLVGSIRGWQRRSADFTVAACMIGLALTLQANLMRLLGPPGDLDIGDVFEMKWPAAVSLLWASIGCALTIWSRKISSRVLWTSGAALLVAAAVKVLLVDFGSLGQLANILSVIAAGGMFLLVGWLAPIPPAAKEDAAPDEAEDTGNDAVTRNRRNAWSLAIVLVAAVGLFDFNSTPWALIGQIRQRAAHAPETSRVVAAIGNDTRVPSASVSTDVPTTEPDLVRDSPLLAEPQAVATASTTTSPPPSTDESATSARDDTHTSVLNVNPEGSKAATAAAAIAVPRPEPSRPREYVPPPTVDENGVRTYTQYSLPQPRHEPGHEPPRPGVPAPGEEGIDQLLREGRIRRATPRDMDQWVAATGSKRPVIPMSGMSDYRSGGQFLFRTYVVIREMTFPEGLHGAHSATFIVPRHVTRPYGNPGHSTVIEMP